MLTTGNYSRSSLFWTSPSLTLLILKCQDFPSSAVTLPWQIIFVTNCPHWISSLVFRFLYLWCYNLGNSWSKVSKLLFIQNLFSTSFLFLATGDHVPLSLQTQCLCSLSPLDPSLFSVLSNTVGKERRVKQGTCFPQSLAVCQDLMVTWQKGSGLFLMIPCWIISVPTSFSCTQLEAHTVYFCYTPQILLWTESSFQSSFKPHPPHPSTVLAHGETKMCSLKLIGNFKSHITGTRS